MSMSTPMDAHFSKMKPIFEKLPFLMTQQKMEKWCHLDLEVYLCGYGRTSRSKTLSLMKFTSTSISLPQPLK